MLLSVRETVSVLETIPMISILLFVIQISSVKEATTGEILSLLFIEG